MTITLSAILYILIFHWIADFIMQSDYHALNKSKSNIALLHHVLVYSAIMLIPSILIFTFITKAIIWVIINAILHFATDYISSRLTSYLYKKGDRHNFFVVIGLDQTLHFIALFTTLVFLFERST